MFKVSKITDSRYPLVLCGLSQRAEQQHAYYYYYNTIYMMTSLLYGGGGDDDDDDDRLYVPFVYHRWIFLYDYVCFMHI